MHSKVGEQHSQIKTPTPTHTMNQQSVFSFVAPYVNGFSPCVIGGVLSNATCKRVLRKVAKVGDLVLIYTAKRLNDERQLICMYRVTAMMPVLTYMTTDHGQGRRCDQIYDASGQYIPGVIPYHASPQRQREDLYTSNKSTAIDQNVMLSTDYAFYTRFADYTCKKLNGVPLAVLAGIDGGVKLTHDRGYKKTTMTADEVDRLQANIAAAAAGHEFEFMLSYAQQSRMHSSLQNMRDE
jgi:hypothetical protein